MRKILGLLVFCSLLRTSQGTIPGISSTFSPAKTSEIVTAAMQLHGDLVTRLKDILLPDVKIAGLLGLVGSVTGQKIVNVQIIGNRCVLMPEIIGGRLSLTLRLEITGDLLLGLPSVIKISVELTAYVEYGLVNFSGGNFDLKYFGCGCQFGTIDISVLDRTLLSSAITAIKDAVSSSINLQICPILSAAFVAVKAPLLSTVNVVLPFDSHGALKCLLAQMPTITTAYFGIDVIVDFDVVGKGLISIPDGTSSLGLPSIGSYGHCQCLHPAFLNIVLSVVVKIAPQELSCTPDAFSGAAALKDAILALIPSGGSSGITSTNILFLKVSLVDGPLIEFASVTAAVKLNVEIEVFIKNADGSNTSILIVRDALSLSISFSVVDGRLILILANGSHDLQLVSSSVGISEVASLVPHCSSLLGEILLPLLNGLLHDGIPLLDLLHVPLINVTTQIIAGALVICV